MNIIITGAGKGIGYELAKNISGKLNTSLYLISRSEESLQKLRNECLVINKNTEIFCIPFDLKKVTDKNIYPVIACDHIDVLINNAGSLANKSFEQLTMTEINQMIDVNFLAPTLLIKKYITKMGGSKGTHIVNIGSMGGFQGSSKFPGLSIYSATKAALASLTECLAVELMDKNIKCNCLALGAVQTEMLNTAFPGYKAPVTSNEMGQFIADFALSGHKVFNGKIIPVAHTVI